MHEGKYVFAQLCKFLPKRVFDCLVDKYEGNKYIKSFTCWNHLLVLIAGQLSNRESLRDLVITLNAHKDKFYHLGFGKSITRSNLSKANEIRDVRIFREFSERMILISKSKSMAINELPIINDVYAFDSSIVTLCSKTFWWSRHFHSNAGIKLHTLYDVKSEIPLFNVITDHLVSDCSLMKNIPYYPDAFYVFDKAYVSTPDLFNINISHAFFVVRRKHNMVYKLIKQLSFDNKDTGVLSDEIIEFTSRIAKKGYNLPIRQVTYYSSETNSTFIYLTNNFEIEAENIALIYKYRWRIELFFKWIKQHLNIKEFYGTSENAVQTQIYSAIITYCLIYIVKSDLGINSSLYEMMRILGFSLIEKTSLKKLLTSLQEEEDYQNDTQLKLNLF